MKSPVFLFSFLWVLCCTFTIHFLFFPTKKDEKNYEKTVAYFERNNSKKLNHTLIQRRKGVQKQLFSKDLQGFIFAKESRWIFDPKEKIFQEEFTDLNGTLTQEGSTKTFQAKKGIFDFHTHDLILYHCNTSVPYKLEEDKVTNITSFSKKACFHLDPKGLSFELGSTNTKIIK